MPPRKSKANRSVNEPVPHQELPAQTSQQHNLLIGPAGWSYPDWAGHVYPSRRSKGFHELNYLAEFFDTIEINTSFYQPLRPDHARQWVDRVSANSRFVFTAKLWQQFTHNFAAASPSSLAKDERDVRAGFDVLRAANRLGAVLLQFPFSFHRTPETVAYLSSLLKRFADYPLVVEVRHSTWDSPETLEFFRSHSVSFCNIDQPVIGRSIAPSSEATSPVGYVRLHGRRYDTWFTDDESIPSHERYNYLYSLEELAPWTVRIQKVTQRARTTFVITNNHFQGKSVVNALQLINILKKTKVKVPEPLRRHYPDLEKIADRPAESPLLFPLQDPQASKKRSS